MGQLCLPNVELHNPVIVLRYTNFKYFFLAAFEIDDYDFHNNHTYSSWSESSWQATSSRMFLKADPVRERGYLALGIFLLISSFISVIWLDKFATEIFVEAVDAEQSQAVSL